jgi:hypothetical protein
LLGQSLAQALQNYFQGQKTRQEQAITAAAQLLDPLAKLRLMQMLQGHSGGGPSAVPAGEYPPKTDPSVLLGLRRLSLERNTPYQPSYPPAEAMHAAAGVEASLLGAAPAFVGFQGPPALARRSIDIGSLYRTGVNASVSQEGSMGSAGAGDAQLQPNSSFSVDLSETSSSLPHVGPLTSLIHGSLPTASYMEFAAGLGRTTAASKRADEGRAAGNNDMLINTSVGGKDTAAPSAFGSNSSSAVSGLQSIDEMSPIDDESGSSAVSGQSMGRSGSASSSLDISGKESAPFHRVVSFDK